MRALVTGGAGYVGSVVAEVLVASGHEVVVVDNLQRGFVDAVPAAAEFVHADLLDLDAIRAVLVDRAIEAVVHLAASSLVGDSVKVPSRYYRNNVTASLALLDTMRTAGVRDLVFSSSAAVYGEPERQPIDEDAPMRPTNPYGETKLVVERAMHWYAQSYGLRCASLRYFNAAGATERRGERHDPESHLIPTVLEAAAGIRRAVQVFGEDYPTPDGSCVRDYVHVEDLATAHLLVLEALRRGDRTELAYNLGCGGRGYSVFEVMRTVEDVTGRVVPVQVGPRRAGDPAVLVAASDRIRRELGWTPRHPELRDIVASAWRWMRAHRP